PGDDRVEQSRIRHDPKEDDGKNEHRGNRRNARDAFHHEFRGLASESSQQPSRRRHDNERNQGEQRLSRISASNTAIVVAPSKASIDRPTPHTLKPSSPREVAEIIEAHRPPRTSKFLGWI